MWASFWADAGMIKQTRERETRCEDPHDLEADAHRLESRTECTNENRASPAASLQTRVSQGISAMGISFSRFHERICTSWGLKNEEFLKRYPEIGELSKDVLLNPPKGSIEPLTRLYRTSQGSIDTPFWNPPPNRFLEPQREGLQNHILVSIEPFTSKAPPLRVVKFAAAATESRAIPPPPLPPRTEKKTNTTINLKRGARRC